MLYHKRYSLYFFPFFFFFTVSVSSLHAQLKTQEKEIVAVSAGYGVLTFHGDVGGSSLVGAYSFIRNGFSLSAEKKLNRNFLVSLNLLKGKVARDDKASDDLPKLNFESPITQVGLAGTWLLTGKKEKEHEVVPFFSAGLAFLSFDPHGDLQDKSGNPYYYWKDGSIRDLPERGINLFYAHTVSRDYVYETRLKDSTVNYSRTTFAIPLTTGVKLKLTPIIDVNLALTYHYSFTDYLDNVKKGGNDAYLFSSVSLTYHFIRLPKKQREEVSQLFVEIDKMDSDGDGVPDADDLCPNTPKGIKVDGKGCPIDSDADGVPDYLDKEPHSKGGLPVDVNGVELTKARMLEIQKQMEGPAADRKDALSEAFNKKPSASFMKEVEAMEMEKRKNPANKPSANSIPYDLRVADWNKDGFITSDEIAKTIDAFFDGSITFNAEQIHRLIDYFFEQ